MLGGRSALTTREQQNSNRALSSLKLRRPQAAPSHSVVLTVSNTSPLLNLAIIGRLGLVRSQFGSVLVPPAVVKEFHLEEGRPGSSALRQAIEGGWIVEKEPSDDPLVRTLRQDLDQGESEAIALAVEEGAGLILLDEREGRRRARNVGLEMTGALGILAQADRRGNLDSISRLRLIIIDSGIPQRTPRGSWLCSDSLSSHTGSPGAAAP